MEIEAMSLSPLLTNMTVKQLKQALTTVGVTDETPIMVTDAKCASEPTVMDAAYNITVETFGGKTVLIIHNQVWHQ
jgi:hypothetical protein